jgi:GT2 family glycosyltransferase
MPPSPSDARLAPRVGIVLVTYNGLALTRACLDSLRHVEPAPDLVVAVDNASHDGTAAALAAEYPEVVVLPQTQNLGFTGGNNVGIRWCLDRGCDAVLLLNNDTEVTPDFLARLLRHCTPTTMVVPQIRAIADRAQNVTHVGVFDFRRGILEDAPDGAPLRDAAGPVPVGMASACCLLVHRAVFDAVGLLDDQFFLYHEDTDFILRAQTAGARVVYEPAAVIYHHEGASSGAGGSISPLMLYYTTRNRLLLMSKHGRFGGRFLAYFAVGRTVYAVRFVLRGEWRLLRALARAVTDYRARRFSRADGVV